MWRRIATVMAKDVRTARRDSLATYVILAPLLMAVLLRLILPLVEGSPYTFAVSAGLDGALVDALEAQGEVRVLPDREAVVDRVMRIDDVTGVVPGADRVPEVILEGNESDNARRVPGVVVDAHAEGRVLPPPTPVHGEHPVGTILAAVAIFCTILLAGLAIGFTVLEERERAVAAFVAVSPIRFGEYLTGKLLGAGALGLGLAYAGALVVLDGDVPFGPFLVAAAATLPSGLLLGLLVGAFATNQLQAIAMLKALLFLFSSLPVIGFAVLETPWEWLVAPFANHWAAQALFTALHDRRVDLTQVALAVGLALPPLAVVVPLMRRRLGLGT